MPDTPVRLRSANVGSPPPVGSVAPLPGTFSVHSGAFSRASRLAEAGFSYQTARAVFATAVCACVLSGTQKPRTNAPCATATVARNSRRVTSVLMSLPHQIGGEMNHLPDAVIRAAP